MATEICQYCGVNLDETPPTTEVGWVYGIECSQCAPDQRRSIMLARTERVAELRCPTCGARIAPADDHPDVVVVKEITYEVCSACGERCGVASARRVRDAGCGTM